VTWLIARRGDSVEPSWVVTGEQATRVAAEGEAARLAEEHRDRYAAVFRMVSEVRARIVTTVFDTEVTNVPETVSDDAGPR
jgi:hypothetical protein